MKQPASPDSSKIICSLLWNLLHTAVHRWELVETLHLEEENNSLLLAVSEYIQLARDGEWSPARPLFLLIRCSLSLFPSAGATPQAGAFSVLPAFSLPVCVPVCFLLVWNFPGSLLAHKWFFSWKALAKEYFNELSWYSKNGHHVLLIVKYVKWLRVSIAPRENKASH